MEKFKIGDRVYHIIKGWGIVTNTENAITVKFENETIVFFVGELLSFTEYTLQGFSQERPIELPKVGELCLMRDNDYDKWQCKIFNNYDPTPGNIFFITDSGEGFKQMKRIKIID